MTARRRRRRLGETALAATLAAALPRGTRAAGPTAWPGTPHVFPAADPAYRLTFPRDYGAHPAYRTEWWYVTGWLDGRIGFQLTFFRVRTGHPDGNPSRFAPTELLFAHAALMVPARATPLHAERSSRLGAAGVSASPSDTALTLGDWSLVRAPDDRYRARVADAAVALDLTLTPVTPTPWLQGEHGFSRKGPLPEQASHYYSRPQLAVAGTIHERPDERGGSARPVRGNAWFDHEWSTTVLDPEAAGWDWTGLNLDDGSALVAFRIRRRGSRPDEPIWSYAAHWWPDGRRQPLAAVRFQPLREWRSPRTGGRYPVAMRLILPDRTLTLEPLFDDQELDSRGSTGTIYWEGAVTALQDGRRVGAGYLELTGYQGRLRL
ncbi:MAG: lipocalin-like domain-containing protein [Lautropia sp.]